MDTETADAGFLNARQEAFCRNFIAGGSAVAAARAAGYAETTARAQAARLLQHPKVQHRIEQLRADEDGAKAALCGRLLQDVHAVRERAMENGDDGMALRAINTTLHLVRQLGMPATPPDTQDILLDGAAAEADADADAAEGHADPDVPVADADGDVLAAGQAMLADVGECRSDAGGDADADGEAVLADVGECRSDTRDGADADGEAVLADVGGCRLVGKAVPTRRPGAMGASSDMAVGARGSARVDGRRMQTSP